ncbi:MAG: signal peptidase II [Acidobacteriota bacterium]|nr:signal peptidase II [Acidobacteriota bacterium]MDQ7088846.1 signal peptidase II [Acidobacteriota bacterium]
MRSTKGAFLLALGLLAADQASKAWAASGALDRPVELVPGLLRLTLGYNSGALFGILADLTGPPRTLILLGIPCLAVGLMVYLLLRTGAADRTARLALAIMLGGALGNLVDRILHGRVVDFIDVHAGFEPLHSWLVGIFGTSRWPTFNVADMGLSCGALLLLASSLGFSRAPRTEARDDAPLPD